MSDQPEHVEESVHAELRALETEYAATEPAASPSVGAAPAIDPAPPPMDWRIPATLIVGVLDRIVAPNWDLEKEEKEILHDQLVQTLAVLFPQVNLDPRIVAVISLGATVTAIVAKRLDPESGKLKPLRAAPDEDDDNEGKASA